MSAKTKRPHPGVSDIAITTSPKRERSRMQKVQLNSTPSSRPATSSYILATSATNRAIKLPPPPHLLLTAYSMKQNNSIMPNLFVTIFHRHREKRRDDARLQCNVKLGGEERFLLLVALRYFFPKIDHMLKCRLKVIATFFMCLAKSADQEINIEMLHPK